MVWTIDINTMREFDKDLILKNEQQTKIHNCVIKHPIIQSTSKTPI